MLTVERVLSAPCVFFALRRESMDFRRAYPASQPFPGAPCRAQFRRPREAGTSRSAGSVLMLETGIGAAAMESALSWCLNEPRFRDQPYRPRFVVSVGYSGALQPEQHVGDLVLATEVVDQQGKHWPAILPTGLTEYPITAGRVLTVSRLVNDPDEKQRLGRQYDALAVDMESAVVARLCHQHNIPFICLRVISDDCQTELSPHLVELLQQDRVSLPRLTGQVLRHPRLIGELWRLAKHTRRASRRLTGPLSEILTNVQNSHSFSR